MNALEFSRKTQSWQVLAFEFENKLDKENIISYILSVSNLYH